MGGEVEEYYVGGYRYSFQNQEVDNDIKGKGNSVNYKYRMHDPRVGRWLSVDNYTRDYGPISPYTFSLNNPIYFIDSDGNKVIGLDGKEVTINKTDNGYVIQGKPDKHTQEYFAAILTTPTGVEALEYIISSESVFQIEISDSPISNSKGDNVYAKTVPIDKDGNERDFNEISPDDIAKYKVILSSEKADIGGTLDKEGVPRAQRINELGVHERAHMEPNGKGGDDYNPKEKKPFQKQAQSHYEYSELNPDKSVNSENLDNAYKKAGDMSDKKLERTKEKAKKTASKF